MSLKNDAKLRTSEKSWTGLERTTALTVMLKHVPPLSASTHPETALSDAGLFLLDTEQDLFRPSKWSVSSFNKCSSDKQLNIL